MKSNKPIAIVLGGTAPHIMLIDKLHERGYYSVLIDYLPNPPAKRVADEHVQVSILDKERVLEIATDYNASLVISTCIDQANSVCCYVAEKLGLPHPYSYETSLYVTNKGLMKKRMKDCDIPTSSFVLAKNISDIDWNQVYFPCVVKPVDCNSSKGVHRADNIEDVRHYIEEALRLSQTNNAIIEGFCEGEEIQVDCVALDNDADVVMTRSKVKKQMGDGAVLNSFGSIVPAQISKSVFPELKLIAQKIARGFGLCNTPFFYQAIVTNEQVNVLEFAPRVGGGLSYYMINNFVGFDAVEAAIDSFLGQPIVLTSHKPGKVYRTCLLYAQSGTYDHVEGLDELRAEGVVKDYFVTKNSGDVIDGDMRSSNRIGSYIIESSDVRRLNEYVSLSEQRVIVRDINGRDITFHSK